jgi:hypothetical protein
MSEELEGDALDNAVTLADAQATGLPASWAPYSTSWEYGGPIIERERIWLTSWPDGTWGADIAGEPGDPSKNLNPKPGEPGHVKATAQGPTPLIAAMRCFVASMATGTGAAS